MFAPIFTWAQAQCLVCSDCIIISTYIVLLLSTAGFVLMRKPVKRAKEPMAFGGETPLCRRDIA